MQDNNSPSVHNASRPLHQIMDTTQICTILIKFLKDGSRLFKQILDKTL